MKIRAAFFTVMWRQNLEKIGENRFTSKFGILLLFVLIVAPDIVSQLRPLQFFDDTVLQLLATTAANGDNSFTV